MQTRITFCGALLLAIVLASRVQAQSQAFLQVGQRTPTARFELFTSQNGVPVAVNRGQQIQRGTRVKARLTVLTDFNNLARLRVVFDLGQGAQAQERRAPGGFTSPPVFESSWADLNSYDPSASLQYWWTLPGIEAPPLPFSLHVSMFDLSKLTVTEPGGKQVNLPAGPKFTLNPVVKTTVSKMMTVPNLVGKNSVMAGLELVNAGFKGRVVRAVGITPDPAKNTTVAGTSPAAGAQVDQENGTITINVWEYKAPVMPEVRGKKLAEAVAALRAAGIMGPVQESKLATQDPAHDTEVSSQNPAAGQAVALGAGVVKLGVAHLVVKTPGIEGMTEPHALMALHAAGLKNHQRTVRRTTNKAQVGTIQAQSPIAGQLMSPTETLRYYVYEYGN